MADEFKVHLNSVENSRRHGNEFGLIGVFEGLHPGRPAKVSDEERRRLADSARDTSVLHGQDAAAAVRTALSMRRAAATASKNL
ncbi:hypothetical protein BN2497_3687 [Janthinobacterium sp. CG23_2]|nr:hypothetical protein BN2497_3687 [Janthinobacterium sp. CG23_2]CUU28241.1 hypothetical protein BN3177_3687 [Janthinobacterium sp. CG23_2]